MPYACAGRSRRIGPFHADRRRSGPRGAAVHARNSEPRGSALPSRSAEITRSGRYERLLPFCEVGRACASPRRASRRCHAANCGRCSAPRVRQPGSAAAAPRQRVTAHPGARPWARRAAENRALDVGCVGAQRVEGGEGLGRKRHHRAAPLLVCLAASHHEAARAVASVAHVAPRGARQPRHAVAGRTALRGSTRGRGGRGHRRGATPAPRRRPHASGRRRAQAGAGRDVAIPRRSAARPQSWAGESTPAHAMPPRDAREVARDCGGRARLGALAEVGGERARLHWERCGAAGRAPHFPALPRGRRTSWRSPATCRGPRRRVGDRLHRCRVVEVAMRSGERDQVGERSGERDQVGERSGERDQVGERIHIERSI